MRRLGIISLALALLALAAPAQADTPKFQIRCLTSHVAQVDPIVAPGGPSAHEHEFFGNKSVNADSTFASMLEAGTTCSSSNDTAGYWTPTLIGPGGGVVRAQSMLVYYRGGPRTVAFPPDLRMISDHLTIGKPGRLRVGFPTCWDGVHTDSTDHMSHMSFKRGGQTCPASHPVEVPHITEVFRYNGIVQDMWPMGYGLSSGGFATGHADFWNTWKQNGLEALVVRCLNGGLDCGRIDT